jgi:prolyl oligopeptidase
MCRLEPRKTLLAISIPVVVLSLLAAVPGAERRPPKTKTDDVKDSYGSVQVADPYRWLEDQKAPETRAWIDEQNRYSESYLHDFPGRDAIRRRLGELLKVETIGVPQEHGGRYFFTRRLADQDLPVLYVRKGLSGADEVLLDPHPLSPDHTTSIALLDVIEDGSLIAY